VDYWVWVNNVGGIIFNEKAKGFGNELLDCFSIGTIDPNAY
jgi:hypothetical protein